MWSLNTLTMTMLILLTFEWAPSHANHIDYSHVSVSNHITAFLFTGKHLVIHIHVYTTEAIPIHTKEQQYTH